MTAWLVAILVADRVLHYAGVYRRWGRELSRDAALDLKRPCRMSEERWARPETAEELKRRYAAGGG